MKFIRMTALQRDCSGEETIKAMNSSVAFEEREITTGVPIRKKKLVRNATTINLTKIQTSIFISLMHIYNDCRDVIASQWLEIF